MNTKLFDAAADTLFSRLAAEIMTWPGDTGLTEKDRLQFLDQLLHGETQTDLLKRPEGEAIATVKYLWEISQIRLFEDIFIHVQEDSYGHPDRVDITIAQRQIPFITDSVLNRLRQGHLSVAVMINATMKVRRDDDGNLLSVHNDEDHGPDLQMDKILHLQCEHRGEELDVAQIHKDIFEILRDVQAVVEDWRPMQGQIVDTINELENHPAEVDGEDAYETAEFLSFLKEGDFTFLGYREHGVRRENGNVFFDVQQDKSLGLLRDQEYLLFDGLIVDERIPKEVQRVMSGPAPLMMVLKANRLSSVHRHVHMDVIIIKRYNKEGEVASLRLFAGLFTAQCYAKPPEQIPFLKRKVNAVLVKSGFDPDTHSWRALRHVMESFSRDELFQIDVDLLYEQATAITRLNNRPEVDVFVRKDPLQRYFSVLVFVPKDQYNTTLRIRTKAILEEALHGKVAAHYMTVDEKALARLQYMVICGTPLLPEFDLAALKQRLVDACMPWFDRLKIAASARFGKDLTRHHLHGLTNAFSVGYQDQVSIERALDDLAPIQEVAHIRDMVVTLNRYDTDEPGFYRIKFYKRDDEASLSKLLPMLERMGFDCLHEYSYPFHLGKEKPVVWLHELVGTIANFNPQDLGKASDVFADAFEVIWRGMVDSDSFNTLVLAASLTWREANLFRAFARYLDLANYPLGKRYLGQVLAKYPLITTRLKDFFLAKMDPSTPGEDVEPVIAGLLAEIDQQMEQVEKLDEDRALRSVLNLIHETLRTNYFHKKPADESDILVLKFNAANIKDLPKPRPYREIFVHNTRMEAVHLRGGPIARGGIRWSDRFEDFRTEILGLIKAQTVKNAVIVPVGAKGGFICKNQSQMKTPQERMAEGIACYKIMITAMLSITDNLLDGKIVPPENTVRLDGDDPYLVVAADKGTASFSDIANKISVDHHFWLGDAFASGGSQGYDHKAMGITARGAWECIKRHFREMGKDIQSEEFTVAGVGDMSGDVFGNGMLLSEKIRLVAAFDHRHIFVDPTPDAAKSFVERKRLFDKPASSWMDYDTALLSPGGKVYDRQEKSLTLTKEIRDLLEITTERVTPTELMQAILKANVELMYFGGIGTYVKASHQSHEQVGDKANDALRINAVQLRCKVLGEGANLAITQAARIEYAQNGGRIDTDFIDNSAGVDTSDHEVNIKILLQPMLNSGAMPVADRDVLLKEMTEDVAAHVLKNNYDQSLALSLQEKQGVEGFASQIGFMRLLEKQNLLDRALEGLPDDEHIQQLLQNHTGLTRPDLCVLLAYAKMTLFTDIMKSALPDEPALEHQLFEYFPDLLQQKFKQEIAGHKLRREIIATELANVIVNTMGPIFVSEEVVRGGYTVEQVARAWLLARDVFQTRVLWSELSALDARIPGDTQLDLYGDVVDLMTQAVRWFLHHHADELNDAALSNVYRDDLDQLVKSLPEIAPTNIKTILAAREQTLASMGAINEPLRQSLTVLPVLLAACNVIYLTRKAKAPAQDVAEIFFALDEKFSLSSMDDALEALPATTAWDQEVIESLRESFQTLGSDLAVQFLESGKKADELDGWLAERGRALEAVTVVLEAMKRSGSVDLTLLMVINQRLQRFAIATEA